MRTTRFASMAIELSWVIITMVFPSSFNCFKKFKTSRLVLESRAPVGSSAMMMGGLVAMARAMAARYEQFDPDHADLYRQNLAALDADLQDAQKILAEQLAPFAGRTFLVYHPAYGYFAHEFQLRQKAIEYDGKPPTAKQLSELKKEQALSGAGILFSQPQTNSTLVDNVAAALQCKVVVLDPLAENILDNFHQLALAFAEEFQKESHDE